MTTKINVQTNGGLEEGVSPIRKVKLYEKMSEADISALIEKKRKELPPPDGGEK